MFTLAIITAYHNTKYDMFSTCLKSVLKHVVPYVDFEWIIVSHNCNDEHNKFLSELKEKHSFINLFRLDNDKFGCFSPKQYGLEKSNSKYVVFLDSDDYITDGSIEHLIKTAQHNKCQVVYFRRQLIGRAKNFENFILTPNCNQDVDLVIYEEPLCYKDFYDNSLYMLSGLYDSRFLRKHSIRFDDNISFYEDIAFNLAVIDNSKKIAVLPNCYFMAYLLNADSMTHVCNDNFELIKNNTIGILFLLDKLLSKGYIYWHVLSFCVRYVVQATKNFDEIKKETLYFLLKKYILRPISFNDLEHFYQIHPIKKYILSYVDIVNNIYHYDFKNIDDTNIDSWLKKYNIKCPVFQNNFYKSKLLKNIISENRMTLYGKSHYFNSILTASGYKNRCNISTIEYYYNLLL